MDLLTLSGCIQRIITRHNLLTGAQRHLPMWDITGETTAILDAAARRFDGWELRRILLSATKEKDDGVFQPSRHGFLFYLSKDDHACHLHGPTTKEALTRRLTWHPVFLVHHHHFIQNEMLPPTFPGEFTDLDHLADLWWDEEVANCQAHQLENHLRMDPLPPSPDSQVGSQGGSRL